MRGEVLEELHPPLRRILRMDAPGDFARWPKITGKLADGFLENMFQQIILVLIVTLERGPIDRGAPGNISDGDCIKAALGSQFDECLLQQLVRAPDTWIGLSMSHFALFVAYATFKRDCILITRRVAITLNVTLRHIYNEMLYSASTEFSGYAL
jgi:hypothetical protein